MDKKERIFFMIKPDGLILKEKIISMISEIAEVRSCLFFDLVDIKKIESLYEMHLGQYFYDRLINSFRNRGVMVFVLEPLPGYKYKEGFIEDLAVLVGDTDPSKATPGTIRSLSNDSISQSIKEERAVRNLVHRSRTSSEAEHEILIFFND